MPRVIQSPEDFHIIAENIHATQKSNILKH